MCLALLSHCLPILTVTIAISVNRINNKLYHKTLNKQVFSEHEQAPTPPKSFSSISEVSMTFRSNVLARTSSSLEKPLFLAILANFTTSGRVFFDRNGQKAHLRTKTLHLSL